MNNKKMSLLAAAAVLSLLTTQGALAQKKYDTGASDTEIKIGMSRPTVGLLPPTASSARPRKPISR
jgi:hypothetical protein